MCNEKKHLRLTYDDSMSIREKIEAVCKRIYRITLPATDSLCLLTKTLVVDLLKACPGYDHDKPEGMVLINDSTLGVVNDDDFGIEATFPAGCRYRQKLKNNGRTDRNEIFFFGF